MKASTNMLSSFIPDEQNPLILADFDALIFDLSNLNSDIPQPDSKPSRWSKLFLSPPQQTSYELMQPIAYTLTNAPNPNYLQTFILTRNSDST